MSKLRFFLAFLSILMIGQNLQVRSQSKETLDLMRQIRRDKFDAILPQVMRDKGIDMWIQVIQPWTPDPLSLEFGSNSGVFIFTDRGGDKIERAVFDSEVQDPDVYDIFSGRGTEFFPFGSNAFIDGVPVELPGGRNTVLDLRFSGIEEFVSERDPKSIAVNYTEKRPIFDGSEIRALSDGISHTDYLLLVDVLGNKYAKRVVSADFLISDYLSRRVKKEIELYRRFSVKASENIDEEFAKIEVGITKLGEILQVGRLKHPDGTRVSRDHVIQGGDLLTILHGHGDEILQRQKFVEKASGWMVDNVNVDNIGYRVMHASAGGHGYVLREGETELPPEIQKIWKHGMAVRRILENNIKAGPTGDEILKLLIRKLAEEGYLYTPVDRYDVNADPEKTQVFLDVHAKGKGVVFPRISPLGPDWERDMRIPLNHTFTFEYMIHMPVPEVGRGSHLYLQFHDSVIATEHGVEYPSPPSQGIRIIR